jgi:Spy/CpxP family protein refolding chaperone
MKMTKLLLVLAFLVVMAAGGVVGMAVDRQLPKPVPAAEPAHSRQPGPMYPKVSPEQKAKIDEIWAPVVKLREPRYQQRHALETKRSQDIQALLTPDQKEKYDAIQTAYRADVQRLEDALQDAVRTAETQTRAILNDEQRKQYDDWARRRGGGPGRGGPGRGGPGRGGPPRGGRDRSRPTTMPTTLPANSLTSAN